MDVEELEKRISAIEETLGIDDLSSVSHFIRKNAYFYVFFADKINSIANRGAAEEIARRLQSKLADVDSD